MQDNGTCASCTIRDVDPELCTQFMLALMCMCKLQTYGSQMTFLRVEKTPNSLEHWSNFKLSEKKEIYCFK